MSIKIPSQSEIVRLLGILLVKRNKLMLAYVLMPLRTESGTILVSCGGNDGIYTDDPAQDKEGSAVERYLKVREENPDSTDLIMKTMGLSPLGPFNSVDKTKLSLKIAQSNNSILSDAIDAITKRIAAA